MYRALILLLAGLTALPATAQVVRYFPVPEGARPHDVAPAPDGSVWYTAQGQGALGRLDPRNGKTKQIPLGRGSAPHGVIVGPDGHAWVTDGGLNAIVRVDARSEAVSVFPLPAERGNANLNTAAFDHHGVLWFTGQNGIYGSLDPRSGKLQVWDAPQGRGPYGITATPSGDVYYASLAGNHIARIDVASGKATVITPPTDNAGPRRIWSDSRGTLWISEWISGQLSAYDPATQRWRSWKLPGPRPAAYAVYVDARDTVWLSDFGANAVVRFEPRGERFSSFPSDRPGAGVRQLLGRGHEVWGAESATDRLVLIDSTPGRPAP